MRMFTTSWCGYCHRLKAQLAREGVVFEEVDIESNAEAAAFVASVNQGNETVPTLEFDDGSTLTNPPLRLVMEKLATLG
jgi:mycoredoxin